MDFLKPHYDTEGPFGLPMKDAQAQALEAIIKTLPQPAEPKFVTLDKAPSELLAGERADVSWISTEDVDRDQEIVAARGMDDSHFKLNPVVTLPHCYSLPPVGKSVWRKRYKDDDMVGIKAKTQYPKRPGAHPIHELVRDRAIGLDRRAGNPTTVGLAQDYGIVYDTKAWHPEW